MKRASENRASDGTSSRGRSAGARRRAIPAQFSGQLAIVSISTARSASRMTLVTAAGSLSATQCDASISVVVADARCAMNRCASGWIALSDAVVTAQLGWFRHASTPVRGVENASIAAGRWEFAMTRATLSLRSAQKTSWNEAVSMVNSVPGSAPSLLAYGARAGKGRTAT